MVGLGMANVTEGTTESSRRASESQTSVLFAHPEALIREGIASILRDAGFRVAAQAGTLRLLRQLAPQCNPDIVLLDCELLNGGADAIRALVKEAPRAAVVILTRPQPSGTLVDVIQAGATGYLSADTSVEEFVHALRLLARGNVIVSREMADSLQQELAAGRSGEPKDDLSERQREVLGLVSEGATNREIAQTLTVTENTVKVHLRRILGKLNLRNRQQAAAYAAREGLASDTPSEDRMESPS